MFGALGGVRHDSRLTFLPECAHEAGVHEKLGLQSHVGVVHSCRSVSKADMVHNAYTPTMEIDAQTYEVRADGQLLTAQPATVLPMAQRYFLF